MLNISPKISVALPVFNSARNIRETLDSLVGQTFKDFEVVVYDDASLDNTTQIVLEYQNRLNIKFLRGQENIGISGARNIILENVTADYIAILDHDDICHPSRLAVQYDYLIKNKMVDACGSAIQYLLDDAEGLRLGDILSHPSDDADIKTMLLYNTALVHPSVMAKRSFFEDLGGYEADFSPAEDYALWCRAALFGKKMVNIEDVLLFYRMHPNQTSRVRLQTLVKMDIAIKRFYIKGLLSSEQDYFLPEFFCPYLRHEREMVAELIDDLLHGIFLLSEKVFSLRIYESIVGSVLKDYILLK